jgi:hypothetical protein
MLKFLKKTKSKVEKFTYFGYLGSFIPREYTETNIPLTNFLSTKEKFLLKCVKHFGKLKYEKNYIENRRSTESFIQINDNLKLYVRLWCPVYEKKEPNWFDRVTSGDFCFVYKDIPIIQIGCHTLRGKNEISISHSSNILHFCEAASYICSQFNSERDDNTFYFMKYQNGFGNESFQNKLFTSEELLEILQKCIVVLENVWDKYSVELMDTKVKEKIIDDKKSKQYKEVLSEFINDTN